MSDLGLYLAAVLIWGSTWIAITFQLGVVAPEVSVAYRFALASALLFGWCRLRRLRLAFPWRDHAWMAAQGSLLFGLNYVCVYVAEGFISSGLVAVVFSLIVFFNIIGTRLLFATPLKAATLFGAVLGVGGVALVFLPELGPASGKSRTMLGLTYALVGTVSASIGNLIAVRNQRRGLPVIQLNTYGMLYGALLVALYAVVRERAFVFDWSFHYVWSLLYLAVFGSILAFGAYLTLVGRIGADRAGYVAAAIPIVALLLSTAFEGLRWQVYTGLGIMCCVVGNVLVLRRKARPKEVPRS